MRYAFVGPGPGLFHSNRGSQYARGNFGKAPAAHGFVPSMSRKDNCWDNAAAESFFATLKNEEVTDLDEIQATAHTTIVLYIHGFYNPTRPHLALGYVSPNDHAKKLKQAPLTPGFLASVLKEQVQVIKGGLQMRRRHKF